ncbi:MAG: cation transporter [Candidatus Thorarchaeota archaeon]
MVSTTKSPSKRVDEAWEFTGVHKSRGPLPKKVRQTLKEGPATSVLYALLCAVYEGVNTRAALYTHLDDFFAMRLRRITIAPSDVDDAIQQGLTSQLIQIKDTRLHLTEEGLEILREGRLYLLRQGNYMRWFYSARVVLVLSALFLIFLSFTKLYVGALVGSSAMSFEGIENLTDLVKVVIVGLSVRYQRDRFGAIIIVGLMLFTGATLAFDGALGLFANEPLTVNFYAFLISFLSIGMNFWLILHKTVVGKMTGNLAFLSDAKDNTAHIKLTIGVLVGLTFAIFHFYFVDSLVALVIAGIILWDGGITLKELITSGEEVSVDSIRLGSNTTFDSKIIDWVLTQLIEGPVPLDDLNQKFLKGVALGSRYYDFHATFGVHELQNQGIARHIKQAIRSNLIIEEQNVLHITDEGLARYYRAKASEYKSISKQFTRTHHGIRIAIWLILIVAAIMLLLIFAPVINQLLTQM